jgi:hypothetical protein
VGLSPHPTHGLICAQVSSSDDEASPRAASAAAAARLPPTPSVEKRELLAAVASPGAVYRTPELLYEPVKASQLDAVRILDENPNRAAWLLLSLKPPRKTLPQAPAPPRRAPKASSAPRPFAPSRFRRNHQAMSKPPQDADGNYPCAHKCGRVFGHAPAAVAHSKVPPASKSNIERLWKTIEAKRRGSLVDFNTGLQNETGGVAADLFMKMMAAIFLKITPKTLCVPLKSIPRLFRLKKNHKSSLYNKFSLRASARHERVCEEEVVVGRQQAVSDGCGGVVDRGLASDVLLSPGRGLHFHRRGAGEQIRRGPNVQVPRLQRDVQRVANQRRVDEGRQPQRIP